MTRKGSQGGILRIAGEEPKVCRERNGIFLPFAYTQTTVRLYANNCSPIPNLNRFPEHVMM